ncbi:sensor histidine kinase [Chromobacterium sp. IIBBL 290-4]|uniref:sensor histidine kinase n=1 Tax=Chromobacterium sp. IIBBL 290-4 TaxID=2953890 RepID=UPI0020B8ADB5|nr:PAS domain S-box protein [Chromobacterium sp. IIBBL 290-4]UTH72815.1 PAS domain S-box protein [Chromobacterium sp. IIBBL 290-4]
MTPRTTLLLNEPLSDSDESEACFRLLVNCVEDYAIYLLDADGRIRSWNAGAERMEGYQAEEVIGRHFSLFYPPDGNPMAKATQELAIASQEGRHAGEAWRVRKDGSRFLADILLTPIYNTAGGLKGYAKITRDISSRKRLEERFHLVVQESPNAMVMVNESGVITLFNRLAELLFGYRGGELLGMQMERLVPERFRKQHGQLRQRFQHQPEARPMGVGRDLFGLRKDGSEFPIEIGLNPIVTEDGPMVLAGIVDMTARKQAQNQLEMALQEKTTLLNEVHHRVKNNLQVIISLLNMQTHYVREESARQALQESQTRVRSMALIHQLLYERHDFSKVDLGEYLQRFNQLMMSSYGLQAGRLRVELIAPAGEVCIELQRATPCGLLINELLTNAIKHAYPEGQGTIWLRLEREDDKHARLTVADHGVGMPKPAREGATSSLGLQLVPMLAEQMGATLEISDNAPGVSIEARFAIFDAGEAP